MGKCSVENNVILYNMIQTIVVSVVSSAQRKQYALKGVVFVRDLCCSAMEHVSTLQKMRETAVDVVSSVLRIRYVKQASVQRYVQMPKRSNAREPVSIYKLTPNIVVVVVTRVKDIHVGQENVCFPVPQVSIGAV